MPAAEYRPASSLSSSTSTLVSDSSLPQNSRMDDQQFITTFFCRAKYDYQSADDASLSFRRGDIIEVLTRLETGWWDGLLGEERGWFPSNYVDIISDEEADIGLAALELQQQQQQQQQPNVPLMPTYSLLPPSPLPPNRPSPVPAWLNPGYITTSAHGLTETQIHHGTGTVWTSHL
jgi:hypothetical protein